MVAMSYDYIFGYLYHYKCYCDGQTTCGLSPDDENPYCCRTIRIGEWILWTIITAEVKPIIINGIVLVFLVTVVPVTLYELENGYYELPLWCHLQLLQMLLSW